MDGLDTMTYREVQKIAKERGLKANSSKKELIAAILLNQNETKNPATVGGKECATSTSKAACRPTLPGSKKSVVEALSGLGLDRGTSLGLDRGTPATTEDKDNKQDGVVAKSWGVNSKARSIEGGYEAVKQKEEQLKKQLKKKFSRPSDDDEAQDGAVARSGMGGGEALHQVEATVQQLPNATKQRVKGPSGRRLPSKKTAEVSEADEGISASLGEFRPTLPGPKKSVVEAVERFASLAAGLSPLPCEALSSSGPRAEAPVRLESSSDATADIRDLVVARKFVLCFCTLGEAHCDCPGELGFEGPGLARGRLVQCPLLTDPLNGTVLEQRLEVAGWDEARPNELRLGLKATEKGVSMEGLIVLEVTRAVVMVKRRKKLSLEWKATFEGVVMKFSSAKHKEKKLGRVKVDKVTMVMWQLAEREEPEPGRWSPGRGLDEDVEDDEEVILGEVFDENEEGNNEIDETIEESKATDEEEDIEETDGEEEDYEDDYIKETDEEFEDEQDGETDVSTDSPARRGEQLGAERSPGEGSDGSMSSDDEEFDPDKLVAKEAKEEYDSNPSDTDGDSEEEEDSSEEEG